MVSLTFENPQYLWYLLSIPLLIASHFYFLRYTKHKGIRFANFDALKRVSGNYHITKNYTLLVIRVLTLVCLILSAAGTVMWYQGEATENDFVLAMDVSASMTSQDIEPARIEAAREAATRFVDRVEEQDLRARIGLLTFSGATYIEQTLTNDMDRVREAIDNMEVRQEGGTDIPGALVTATNMLAGSERGKSILLFSDGSVTVTHENDRSFINALEYANNEQAVVHTIGMGTNTGPIGYLPEFYNVSSTYNEETLKNLANSTLGTHRTVQDQEDLNNLYDTIGSETYETMLDVRVGYGFLLAALFLIFLEWGLVSTKYRRLP